MPRRSAASRPVDAADFASPSGKGATGNRRWPKVALGNAMLMGELGISTARHRMPARKPPAQDGATAIYVAVDGRAAGIIAIADPVKAPAQAALQALR